VREELLEGVRHEDGNGDRLDHEAGGSASGMGTLGNNEAATTALLVLRDQPVE